MHSEQWVRQRQTERALTSHHHDVVQRLCPWVRPRSNCRTDAQTGFTCCSLTLARSRSPALPTLPYLRLFSLPLFCVVINSSFPPQQSLNSLLCFLIFSIEANHIHQRMHIPSLLFTGLLCKHKRIHQTTDVISTLQSHNRLNVTF